MTKQLAVVPMGVRLVTFDDTMQSYTRHYTTYDFNFDTASGLSPILNLKTFNNKKKKILLTQTDTLWFKKQIKL